MRFTLLIERDPLKHRRDVFRMANEILVLIKQCQLHTTHARAVDWEPHGSSPTICAGNADHGFGVCVPLALICHLKIVNLTVLLH